MKKFMSMFLAIIMMFALSVPAFAADAETRTSPIQPVYGYVTANAANLRAEASTSSNILLTPSKYCRFQVLEWTTPPNSTYRWYKVHMLCNCHSIDGLDIGYFRSDVVYVATGYESVTPETDIS